MKVLPPDGRRLRNGSAAILGKRPFVGLSRGCQPNVRNENDVKGILPVDDQRRGNERHQRASTIGGHGGLSKVPCHETSRKSTFDLTDGHELSRRYAPLLRSKPSHPPRRHPRRPRWDLRHEHMRRSPLWLNASRAIAQIRPHDHRSAAFGHVGFQGRVASVARDGDSGDAFVQLVASASQSDFSDCTRSHEGDPVSAQALRRRGSGGAPLTRVQRRQRKAQRPPHPSERTRPASTQRRSVRVETPRCAAAAFRSTRDCGVDSRSRRILFRSALTSAANADTSSIFTCPFITDLFGSPLASHFHRRSIRCSRSRGSPTRHPRNSIRRRPIHRRAAGPAENFIATPRAPVGAVPSDHGQVPDQPDRPGSGASDDCARALPAGSPDRPEPSHRPFGNRSTKP